MNQKQKDELDNINNAPFLFTLGALDSTYEVVGGASNAVQKPDIPPWEVKRTLNTYIDTLDDIASHLKQHELTIENLDKDLFPTLHAMANEVKKRVNTSPVPYWTRSLIFRGLETWKVWKNLVV